MPTPTLVVLPNPADPGLSPGERAARLTGLLTRVLICSHRSGITTVGIVDEIGYRQGDGAPYFRTAGSTCREILHEDDRLTRPAGRVDAAGRRAS